MAAQQVELLLAGLLYNGTAVNAGKIYTYEAGTLVAKATYTDSSKVTAAANPVILDSQGRAAIYAEGNYKFVVKDSNDNTLYTWDNLFFSRAGSTNTTFTDIWGGSSTGSSGAYAITVAETITSYTAGKYYTFIANHAHTTTATLNINGVGAVAINKEDGTVALEGGEIRSGDLVTVVYDGTRFILQNVHLTDWRSDGSGHLVPQVTNARNIGSASLQVAAMWSLAFKGTGADVRLSAVTSHALFFATNNTDRFSISAAGVLLAEGGAKDIGAAAQEMANIYAQKFVRSGADLSIGTVSNNAVFILANNTAVWSFGGSGNLICEGSAKDIGSGAAANSPKAIYVSAATAPASPAAGWVIYVDSADATLKAKNAAGTVRSLAAP